MRRPLKVTAWIIGCLLALVVISVGALLIAGNTSGGRVLIERATARLSDGRVLLTGLSGSFPSAIELQSLRLADRRGVWLTAERLSLHWSPLALLARRVRVADLRVGRLVIERRPLTEASTEASSSPPRTDLGHFVIDALELGPELAGSRAHLTVQGSAHLASLQDAGGTLRARRTDGAGGDYELTLRFDRERMEASLRIAEQPGGALDNLLQVPNLGALTVVANLSGPRTAERVQISAQAGELRAEAQGTIDLSAAAADLDYRLDAPAMAPAPELSWQRIALAGRWHGPLTAPHADGHLLVAALKLPGGAAIGALDAELASERSTLAVHATASGLVLPGPQPRLLADAPLRLTGTLQLDAAPHPLQLNATHSLFSLQAQAVTAGTRSATFDLRLPDLAPFSALAGQALHGSSEIKGTLRQETAGLRLEAQADNQVREAADIPAALLAGPSRAQLAVSLGDSRVQLERLTFSGRALNVSVSGSSERHGPAGAAVQSLKARYQVSLSNLSALSPAVAGTARIDGQITGSLPSLAAEAQLTSSLSIRGAAAEPIEASFKARGLPAQASATVSAHGRLAGAPLQLEAALERTAAQGLRLTVHRSEWKSAHLDGDVTTAANGAAGHGSVNLRIEHLEDLQPLIGTRVAGSVTGALALKAEPRGTGVQLRLEGRDLVVAGITCSARLSASGSSDSLAVQLVAQSPAVQGAPASVDVAGRLEIGAHQLGLQHIEARARGQTLHLAAPARLDYGAGLVLHRLKFAMQDAVVELDGQVTPALDLHARVRHVDPALVNSFVPDLLAQGIVDADAQLQGTLAAPTGSVTLKAAGVRLANDAARDLHALDLQASARLQGNAAQIDAQLSAGTGSRLKVSGVAPLAADGALNLKLSGALDAALVNPVLEAHAQHASGTLTVDVAVAGNARAPEIGGTIDLTRGELRDYTQGLRLSDISAHLVGSRGVLTVASWSARAGPGQLHVTGTVGVLQPRVPVDLQISAKHAQPITSDILTADLDADLKVRGTLSERLDVSGTINVNRGDIGIPGSMPPEVAVLNVQRPGQAAPQSPERKLEVGLDLQLKAPRQIFVQGRGLNAELGGQVRLRGTLDQPRVGGGFDLIRGTFALASTQLTFASGRVSFNGTDLHGKIDPTLDFTAQSTVADASVTLKIGGFADAPQFELSSSPQLPQDEILARLLFGKSASQLSALQVAQIGAALASLSGVGGSGLNPLARVQRALGLDRLSVGSGGNTPGNTQNSGTSVEAGRYVSSRVFVGAKQSTTGFSQLEVDVDLSKHLKLQTRLGNGTATTQGTTPENDPGSSVGVAYQFEY